MAGASKKPPRPDVVAANKKPHRPNLGAKSNVLPEDLRKLQAEILSGLESEDEADGAGQDSSSSKEPSDELTEAAVLQAAGEDNVDDVVQLIFRDRQLKSLTTTRTIDFDRLMNLEILSLSHNLLEDIEPLGILVSLVEININFNRIVDLSPLCDCEHLEKLFASHNRVESVAGLEEGCPKLRELSLYANALSDTDEFMETLKGLPDLRELYIGENECCSAPSQRYSMIRELPSLRVLDGQKLTAIDRKMASAFLEAANKELASEGLDAQVSEPLPRPVTAPAPSTCARPPLPPSSNSKATAAPLAPLPGQKLRSARANRIDDVLTQSREASPESVDSNRMPTLDLQAIDFTNPERSTNLLTVHHDALQQWLDTMHMERENLRFQVRLLEQDGAARQLEQLRADIERLQLENRNDAAVRGEHAQLVARIAEVDSELQTVEQEPSLQCARAPTNQESDTNQDLISQLRWENQLLEKRLHSMRKYGEQLRHGSLVAQVNSKQLDSSGGLASLSEDTVASSDMALVDPELSRLLEENDAKLRRLQTDVTKTARGEVLAPPERVGSVRRPQRQVDVLTLADCDTPEDVEWHART